MRSVHHTGGLLGAHNLHGHPGDTVACDGWSVGVEKRPREGEADDQQTQVSNATEIKVAHKFPLTY